MTLNKCPKKILSFCTVTLNGFIGKNYFYMEFTDIFIGVVAFVKK